MFDKFYIDCKNCWAEIEKQTKVYKCTLWDYYNDEYCPKSILQDMHWRNFICEKCWHNTIFNMDVWRTKDTKYPEEKI